MRDVTISANVVLLDATRQRRVFIDLANASESWIQTRASFALEGIALTDDNAERAGRLLSGAITLEQGYAEIRRKAGMICGDS